LTERQTSELLLAVGALRHERAKFLDGVSAWKASSKYTNKVKRSLGKGYSTSMKVRALRGMAEALQMQIPARAYFEGHYPRGFWIKLAVYFRTLVVLVRLGTIALLRNRELNSEGKIAVVEVWFLIVAKLQESFLPRLGGISSRLEGLFRRFLIRRYERISQYFYYCEGHAAGVANVQKFLVRLRHNSDLSHSQQFIIQSMITDRTGLILAKRNEAERYILIGKFQEAKRIFMEMKSLSMEAGVVLSRLKAVLGLAFIRLKEKPSGEPFILTLDEEQEILELQGLIQGRLWGQYLQSLLERNRKSKG